MALQMTNMAQTLRIGPCDAGMRPSLSWLADELASARPPRMVVLVNPNNPTGECMRPPGGAGGAGGLRKQTKKGVLLTREELEEAKRLCEGAGAWLVVDNTYEHFTFEPEQAHVCVSGDHVINIFSFSKAFGMMVSTARPRREGPRTD